MRLLVTIVLVFSLVGCKTTPNSGLDVTILMGNMNGPFVSREFAERLALLVIEEKYPANVFSAARTATVVDKGALWFVTYENRLAPYETSLMARRLTIEIRKTNGEIVAISSI
jgi:hypothetical protein